jgi:NAD(P)H-dependent flavin oxidoreductase YrpB (nitropropane dioxygenase family)
MQTKLAEELGIDFPIFAFSHCRDVVIEATKAGAIGVLGAVGFMPDEFAIQLQKIDAAVGDRPYGVDVVIPTNDEAGDELDPVALHKKLHALVPAEHVAFAKKILAEAGVPELPEGEVHEGDFLVRSTSASARLHIDEALRHPNVKLIANALGAPPADVVRQIKDAGRLVVGLCGKPQHAMRHVAAGVDIVVAQGTEGGGHTGEIGSIVLWPEVIKAVHPIPVLAAGGVGTGGQIAAALALGAEGVWCGSVWQTTWESDLTDVGRELLVAASCADTVRSKSQTGKPSRLLRNKWTEAWANPDAPATLPLPLQDMVSAEASARAKAYPNRARDVTIIPVGQIVGQLTEVKRTRDVIAQLTEEYLEATERLCRLLGISLN